MPRHGGFLWGFNEFRWFHTTDKVLSNDMTPRVCEDALCCGGPPVRDTASRVFALYGRQGDERTGDVLHRRSIAKFRAIPRGAEVSRSSTDHMQRKCTVTSRRGADRGG